MDSSLSAIPWLSALIFLPLVGVLAVLLSDHRNPRASQAIGIVFSSATLLLCIALFKIFPNTGEMALKEAHSWIPSIGAKYLLGIDGISLILVALTALLTVISLLGSWDEFGERSGIFVMLMLSLESGVIGVFLALDLLLFYIFWEAMLIPMYFLIGLFGGPKRFYATTKFVLFTLFGSLLMLLAIAALANFHQQQFGTLSFALADLMKVDLSPEIANICCFAFLLAFAIKVPMWPLHTWLPDAHTEAPTAGSVMLAGVLLKMGTYGMLRFMFPLFPIVISTYLPWLMGFSVVAIVYGALTALAQEDIKRLIACSSVSHMGFITLGLFSFTAEGSLGGTIQMLNHGISTGALFLMAGMIYHRTNTRIIKDLGGLAKSMPILSTIFVFFCFSSIGLPGLNGFVGEFLIMVGAFSVSKVLTAVATLGIVLGAVYLLWMVERVIFGPLKAGGTTPRHGVNPGNVNANANVNVNGHEHGQADFSHADLGHADHGHADLGHADLGHADLGHADHGHADLGHADLGHADLGHGSDHYSGSDVVTRTADRDLNFREFVALLPLIVGVLYIGLHPAPVLDLARPPLKKIIAEYNLKVNQNKSLPQPNGEEGRK
ncbi:hypothetical protein AUK22_10235 [bacterium CG2_30_54_10]|nr:MAG: hypothetical protein AUK22_10235 [bacterium CG2_30_54_10]